MRQMRVRKRVVLAEPTGEANPRVDHMEFDPLLEELEEREDDRKWMENYKRTHDTWAGVGAGELPHMGMPRGMPHAYCMYGHKLHTLESRSSES